MAAIIVTLGEPIDWSEFPQIYSKFVILGNSCGEVISTLQHIMCSDGYILEKFCRCEYSFSKYKDIKVDYNFIEIGTTKARFIMDFKEIGYIEVNLYLVDLFV